VHAGGEGLPFIGGQHIWDVCELYLDARGGKLSGRARHTRRIVVASGNGGRGPGRGVGGRPRTGRTRPKGDFDRAVLGHDDGVGLWRVTDQQGKGG
jgi:hypothetical protein